MSMVKFLNRLKFVTFIPTVLKIVCTLIYLFDSGLHFRPHMCVMVIGFFYPFAWMYSEMRFLPMFLIFTVWPLWISTIIISLMGIFIRKVRNTSYIMVAALMFSELLLSVFVQDIPYMIVCTAVNAVFFLLSGFVAYVSVARKNGAQKLDDQAVEVDR